MFGKTGVQRALKKKKKLQERNKIPRTKALKKHKQAIKDESKQVLFTVTNNPALPNIQDIPRKKQPILYSTERLKTKSTKKSLLSLSYAHLIFVTYSFVKKTRKHRQFTRDPRCNSKHRCLTCPYIDNGRRSSYTFINARETRNTRHHVTLRPYPSAKNTGETKCTLREHFTEHRQATSNPPHANDEAAVPIRPLYHRHGAHFTGITARSQHIPSQSTSSIPHR